MNHQININEAIAIAADYILKADFNLTNNIKS